MNQVLRHIWQRSDWPSFRFDGPQVAHDPTQARREQGILLGQARALGIAEIDHAINDLWVEDAIATAAIEGEKLEVDSVRSSVMRRLGLKNEGRVERHVEGLVEVMHDATSHFAVRLDADPLPVAISAFSRRHIGHSTNRSRKVSDEPGANADGRRAHW